MFRVLLDRDAYYYRIYKYCVIKTGSGKSFIIAVITGSYTTSSGVTEGDEV